MHRLQKEKKNKEKYRERQTDRNRGSERRCEVKREEWNKTSYDRQTDIYCHKRYKNYGEALQEFLDMYTRQIHVNLYIYKEIYIYVCSYIYIKIYIFYT